MRFHLPLLLVLLASCSKKRGDAVDAALEAAAIPVEPAASASVAPVAEAPPASNEADIARFSNEEKLDRVPEVVDRPTAVRTSPGAGATVASLAQGTKVEELAKRGTFFLIGFSDPKDANKRLIGWVGEDAFKEAPVRAGDAGLKGDGGASQGARDAGPARPSQLSDIIADPAGTTCPPGFRLVDSTKKCHRLCPTVDICGKFRCTLRLGAPPVCVEK